eukprot:TRINITY_DN1527_c0_g1_i4.p1 TRINITY_DN1527_c0_g1~~TRINITY_DN1527_c0_g1_i4.p1  ORF type:complete len:112 (+),score=24.79 TRINITY_DN1527_c0_g1_i4:104-439(+)
MTATLHASPEAPSSVEKTTREYKLAAEAARNAYKQQQAAKERVILADVMATWREQPVAQQPSLPAGPDLSVLKPMLVPALAVCAMGVAAMRCATRRTRTKEFFQGESSMVM